MTDTSIELSEEAFAALFPLRTNHLNPDASWEHPNGGGCLFETFGNELAFVQQQDARTVWTFMEDDNGNPCVANGFHIVNRLGYLIGTLPAPVGVSIYVRLDSINDDVLPAKLRRALRAERAIVDYGLGDRLENLTDLLTDARHWCDENDQDFAEIDRLAYRHYIAELDEPSTHEE